jgi:ribosome-binding factor A
MSEGRRPRRVAETIRKHIAEVFAREMFDPWLEGVMITRVEVGPDLSLARVHVRSLLHGGDQKSRSHVERAANRAVPGLRRGLGARLGLRRLPSITFFYDDGQDAVDRVEELLSEIARDRPPEDA